MPPAPASTDADLILAILERDDRDAFAEIVRRHQSQVRTVLRRLTRGDNALADDLAQETFILAWRNLRHFRFEARFSTWVYRIAFNAWQTEARKRREVLLDADDDERPALEVAAPESGVDVASRLDLERAMTVLSDGERAAIGACYYADLSHEEAAGDARHSPRHREDPHPARQGEAQGAARIPGGRRMNASRNDDGLDRLLRADARRPLEDQGFTARVLTALPSPLARTNPWLKPALVLGSTALGGLLASLLAPIGPMFIEGASQLAHMRGFTPSVAALLAMTSVFVVAGWVLATED
jgi:RNA polymerase sigma-70 factor (ECF subfamily)